MTPETLAIRGVASGIFSPMLEQGIGIEIRGKIIPAEIVKPPFYKNGTRR
jgi:glycine cleavage system aminomethyltransferase T